MKILLNFLRFSEKSPEFSENFRKSRCVWLVFTCMIFRIPFYPRSTVIWHIETSIQWCRELAHLTTATLICMYYYSTIWYVLYDYLIGKRLRLTRANGPSGWMSLNDIDVDLTTRERTSNVLSCRSPCVLSMIDTTLLLESRRYYWIDRCQWMATLKFIVVVHRHIWILNSLHSLRS